MNGILLETSAACAFGAALLGCAQARRLRTRAAAWQAATVLSAAIWAAAVAAVVREPTSAARASACLGSLALALGAWPHLVATLLAPQSGRISGAARILRWTSAVNPVAAVVLAVAGVDWLTGIGAEPVIVLSRAGLVALLVAGIPAIAAVAVLSRQFAAQWARMPRLLLGALGTAASQILVWVAALSSGYVAAQQLATSIPLGAVAAALWLFALLREVPAAPRPPLSRRFVYESAVVGLVLAYGLAAGMAARLPLLASALVGQAQRAALFASIALFVLAWARWRHALRHALNRHVFGGKYDYGEIWIRLAAIASQARGLSDLAQQTVDYCRELLGLAEVSIWVAGPAGDQRRIAASQASAVGAAAEEGVVALAPEVATADDERVAAALGASFVSAMRVEARVVGLLVAGSGATPVSLDEEDRELLRHVSAQLAGALGIYRLGEDLADAREMASFHRLSGFVIHDLKNLAVQQSLVLENAKRHGRDPRFIQDALAAFEDSTLRMRTLIGKLRTQPTEGGAAHRGVCDVSSVLSELLSTPSLAQAHGCAIRASLPEDGLPCLAAIEPASLFQVLSHVAMNAVESLSSEGGTITFAVQRLEGGALRIEVTDDGCGVSAEYLREHAFRPFRTTKRSGMGMGLYQCKTIIEAAGGSIALASARPRGTTVSIVLKAELASPSLPRVA